MLLILRLIFLTILSLPFFLFSQEIDFTLPSDSNDYDIDLLPADFFVKNRNKLRQLMPNNSVAVFFSNPIRNRSNDVDYEYHQDPNFYYLTGLREPHAVVVIFKEQQHFEGLKTDEILFVQEKIEKNEQWSGKVMGKKNAAEELKFKAAENGDAFIDFDFEFKEFAQVFTYKLPEDVKNGFIKADLYGLLQSFRLKTNKLNNIDNNTLPELMAKLRQVKSEEEIDLLRKAVNMTCDAQIELMKALKPGMKEYQSEAIIEYVFKSKGAEYTGFPSILGGGENSCIIHYNSNRKKLNNKELLVSDVGAEYHGYTADITRTIPVDGSFSEEEKAIYNLVLKAQQAGIDSCKAGNKFWAPHTIATKIIADGLMELGIIEEAYQVQQYFMHGTSHYLGLDVHDAGLYGPLEPGNVITVEPGIYIPEGSECDPKWWNIGVRIEDDILITENGPENLSEKAPRKIEEIEALMKE